MDKLKATKILEDYNYLYREINEFMQQSFENINFSENFEEDSDEWYELPQVYLTDKHGFSNTYYIFALENNDNVNYFVGMDLENENIYHFIPIEIELNTLVDLISIILNYQI